MIKKKSFKINKQPVKTFVSLEAGSGTEPVQAYDAMTDTYYPDRTLSPLTLAPIIGYSDPDSGETVTNAASLLTDGHWYRIDNASGGELDSSTEITSDTTYTIDTAAGSASYGTLTSKENVKAGNHVTYVFKANLAVPGKKAVPVIVRWQARSRAVTTVPRLQLDNAAETIYNPWSTDDEYTLNPLLTPAVTGTTYSWESLHGSSWVALGSTKLDWAVTKVSDGVKIKRSIMPDRIDLRCTASVPDGDGGVVTLSVTACVARRLPEYDYDIAHLCDVSSSDDTISPLAICAQVPAPGAELEIIWRNGSGTEIARGLNPVIPLSAFGRDFDIQLEVNDRGGWKALTGSDGAFLIDASGAIIITK